jgi:uncharacterized protein involved in exopolysaccharide biosynthesis
VSETLDAIKAFGGSPNAISIGVATLLGILVALGVVVRIKRQNIRSDSLDKAQDGYRDQLQATVNVLRTRIDTLDQERREDAKTYSDRFDALVTERNALYKLHADITAEIRVLQAEMVSVKLENKRLREQNDAQAEQLRQCDLEARANQMKIASLQREVHELQASSRAVATAANARRNNAAADKQEAAAMRQEAAANKQEASAERLAQKLDEGKT